MMLVRSDPAPDFVGPGWSTFVRHNDFDVVGCVPKISFRFTLEDLLRFPPRGEWPDKTGDGDKLLAAGVDARYVLSEIIKCKLPAEAFGRAYEKSCSRAGRNLLLRLKQHRRDDPTATWLDEYIAAAQQAKNRLYAYYLLSKIE